MGKKSGPLIVFLFWGWGVLELVSGKKIQDCSFIYLTVNMVFNRELLGLLRGDLIASCNVTQALMFLNVLHAMQIVHINSVSVI